MSVYDHLNFEDEQRVIEFLSEWLRQLRLYRVTGIRRDQSGLTREQKQEHNRRSYEFARLIDQTMSKLLDQDESLHMGLLGYHFRETADRLVAYRLSERWSA